ncbi:hypothetical protein J1N35_016800 [Gossypium stocksii]|uniref:Uncharacterized protein n=1 Tax=Gossypium stocksii TaxID=47602 RepID=A0A9D4A554_9ROSI|nr:hypothetical protein J1N35_016800 [Gossypium stocksii]
MSDVKEISKKRKRLSFPATRSLIGSFIRSKSQIQSGSQSQHGRNHHDQQPIVKKLKNSLPDEDSSMGYGLSAVSIKDLRLRRVFSPSSTDGVIPDSFDDTENLGKPQFAGIHLGVTQEPLENGSFKKLDMSNENFVQSTPPDAEIFGAKPVVERNGGEFSDQFLEKKPCEKGFHQQRDAMNNSMKSVLKPCSRARLFRTPGSFSYRRLLPYLMDIEKDHSGSQTMGHPQKPQKGFEDEHLLASNGPKSLPDKTTSCSLVVHDTDSGKPLITASVESFTSRDDEASSMPVVNGEIEKLELQDSFEGQNLNCLKNCSSSTIEDSHFNEENLVGAVSSNKTLTDNVEVAKISVEHPCNAQSLEVLDQNLSTLNNKCESCDYEVTESSEDDTKRSEIQGMPKATICNSFKCQHLNSVDPALSETGGNGKCSLQQRVDIDGEVVERVEDLSGECISMTPPDVNTSSKYETGGSRGNTVDNVSQGVGQVTQKSTNETLNKNNCQGHAKSPDSSPKNKMAPNAHLHLKLSKIPGSFSYSRLLPYLIDITSQNSSASGNNQSLKVEKSSKGKPLSLSITPAKDTSMVTSNDKSCPVERHKGDDIKLDVVAASVTSTSDHKPTESPPKQVAESPMIMNLQEPGPPVKPSALDTSQKLETRLKDVVESPAMSSSSPREEGAKLVANQLSLETDANCIKSAEKCPNHEKQIEASFVEASMPPRIPSASLQKGILKRNPRGCRGICTCLNCSSFRLHAERSFEFSRNQMQDAEEVALDLIKELSYLRNMLEKSAFVAEDQTNICIDQVKEACKKASDAEELAKTRLSGMNNHLNIHCRVPVSTLHFSLRKRTSLNHLSAIAPPSPTNLLLNYYILVSSYGFLHAKQSYFHLVHVV